MVYFAQCLLLSLPPEEDTGVEGVKDGSCHLLRETHSLSIAKKFNEVHIGVNCIEVADR